MDIREEQPSDIEEIWEVNVEAFKTDAEANLVNANKCGQSTIVSNID